MSAFVSIPGADVAVSDTPACGSGPAEIVVLLHGSGPGVSAGSNWSGMIPGLSRAGYRVIAPDIVGFGHSSRPPHFDYRPSGWAISILQLLDHLQISAAHIVGNSMGGRIALNLACRYPDRVSSLTLMGVRSPDAPPSDGLQNVRNYDGTRAGMKSLFQNYFVVNRELISDRMVDERFAAASRDGEAEHYRMMFERPGANQLGLRTDQLGRLTQPVLIVQGREDRVILADDAIQLAHAIPDCICVLVSNCGHWVQIEKPQLFLSLLEWFLA